MTADPWAPGEEWRRVPESQADMTPEGLGPGHPGGGRGGQVGRGRRTAAVVALILGLVGVAVSLSGLAIQLLPRQFTAGQQHQIMSWEVIRRWQTLPAGQIFPASVPYQLSPTVLQDTAPLDLAATRIGIAPQQRDCAKAVTSAAAGAVLGRNGCQVVLRATYVDTTRSYVMTVGVAVLPTGAAAVNADSGLTAPRLAAARNADGASRLVAGVMVVRFGGGSARLYNYNRQISDSFADGPYIVMYSAGYSDSRPRVPVSDDSYSDAEMTSMARGVARAVADKLAATPAPPHCPGAPGC